MVPCLGDSPCSLQFWVLEVYWGAPNAAQDPPVTAPLLSASRTAHLPGQLNTTGLSVPRASVQPSDFTRCLQKPRDPSGSWALGPGPHWVPQLSPPVGML